mmetsp:Transcript_50045/g.121255  ORF Transcript_50045/g.121255 Transcript_50045/m.121255 type:complete len:90 (-) Transcript_50045:192-461(-)
MGDWPVSNRVSPTVTVIFPSFKDPDGAEMICVPPTAGPPPTHPPAPFGNPYARNDDRHDKSSNVATTIETVIKLAPEKKRPEKDRARRR